MNICVIGSGYVGLVTGACLSDFGNKVYCLDIDESKINSLKRGIIPIFEPGLEAIVTKNTKSNRLFFTTNAEEAISEAEVVFIAVGTPPNEDGSADLKYVKEAAATIGNFIKDRAIVVNKSTVPIGSADIVNLILKEQLSKRNVNFEVFVASNPEFLKEGSAIEDFMRPDRVVIGVADSYPEKVLRELYSPIVRNHDRVISMDVKSAELTKYAANSMLATRISFMNELALLAEKVGANIENVRIGIGSDSRIGYSFLYAGCGYGGSCFPKDVKALINTGKKYDVNLKVIESVEKANQRQKQILFDKVQKHFGSNLNGKIFAIWGLSFKPNTDDIREAPSIELINQLLDAGAKIQAYDPIAANNVKSYFKNQSSIKFCDDQMSALEEAEALILVTEWKEFRSPDFKKIKTILKNPVIFDGRNQYNLSQMKESGFLYYSIGR